MKKILIISDSHGEQDCVLQAFERVKPDMVIHLGDHDRDVRCLETKYPQTPVVALRGNCDMMSLAPNEFKTDIENVRIFAAHGHMQNVKSGMLHLSFAAREAEAKLCLFGHTHRAVLTESFGTIFMNPGACGGGRPSYGVVVLNNGAVQANLFDLDTGTELRR